MIIKLLRLQHRLNQHELCKKAGIGINTLVKLEKGEIDSVKVAILRKVAKALDSTVQELFFNEE